MDAPPIIERELRAASRRALTYWMRLAAGLAILAVATPVLIVTEVGPRLAASAGVATGGGIPAGFLGPVLFNLFRVMAFVTSVAAGWYFASDAIAHERREGTLELLFLAPVRPREVVLSKLFTLLWRAAQWLLAVIPIFALPVLAGGVRGRDLLILAALAANTLFWSITTSLYASSKARTVFEALSGTILLQIAFWTLPFAVDLIINHFESGNFVIRAGIINPIFGWTHANAATPFDLGLHFALVHAASWIAVMLTIRRTAGQIRQDPSVRPDSRPLAPLNDRWKYGGAAARAAFRKRLLALHPIRWLVERERGPGRFLLSLLVIILLMVPTAWLVSRDANILLSVGTVSLALYSIVLAVMFAAQATRFLSESRRTGAIELILVSPLSSIQILGGHFQSLLRIFAAPILVLIVGQIVVAHAQATFFATNVPSTTASPASALNEMMHYQWINALIYVVVILLSYVSLAWTGAWMGLACRQTTLALFASLGIAKILPIFASSVVQMTLMPMILSNRIPAWLPFVTQNVSLISFHLALIFVARYQLLPDLRKILDLPHRFVLPTFAAKPPPVLPTLPTVGT